jgi:hypothetical protein
LALAVEETTVAVAVVELQLVGLKPMELQLLMQLVQVLQVLQVVQHILATLQQAVVATVTVVQEFLAEQAVVVLAEAAVQVLLVLDIF